MRCTLKPSLKWLICHIREVQTLNDNKKNVEKDVYSASDTGNSKKIRVLPTGVEPMTFWLLVQMLYH